MTLFWQERGVWTKSAERGVKIPRRREARPRYRGVYALRQLPEIHRRVVFSAVGRVAGKTDRQRRAGDFLRTHAIVAVSTTETHA